MFRILMLNVMSVMYILQPGSTYMPTDNVKYRYFDDYLSHLDRREMYLTHEVEGSGEVGEEPGDEIGSLLYRPLPIRSGSLRSKEVTCCMLGQLAGDKGYHCFVKFYAARIMSRNYNRAHNKKISGLQSRNSATPLRKSSDKLMRSFQQCVTSSRGVIFHKCCHLAAMESAPAKPDNRSRTRLARKLL